MRRLRPALRADPEVLRRPPDVCPQCGKGPVQRLLSSPAIQFKGTGWYITDYAQEGERRKGERRGERRSGGEERAARKATVEDRVDQDRQRVDAIIESDSGAIRRATRRQPASTPATSAKSSGLREAQQESDADLQIERFEIAAERLGQVGPPEREIHQRLQESELVAGVVAHAVNLARVDRPLLQQPAQPVGQLNFAGAVARRRPSAAKMSGVRM